MKIITVCGSVKFKNEMISYRNDQLKNNKWVLLPENMDIDIQKIDKSVKSKMDELHLKKIDYADKILIWNRNGYIGESTKNELDYCIKNNKKIEFLEPIKSNVILEKFKQLKNYNVGFALEENLKIFYIYIKDTFLSANEFKEIVDKIKEFNLNLLGIFSKDGLIIISFDAKDIEINSSGGEINGR